MEKGIDYIGVGAGAMIFNSEGKVFIAQRGQKQGMNPANGIFPAVLSSSERTAQTP